MASAMPPKICAIMDCGKPSVCRQMCHKHYTRWLRYGDPLKSIKEHAPMEERFWRFVDKRGPGECWPWTGHLNANGYGHLGTGGRVGMRGAHRVSYEIHNGPIPCGKIVRHKCDNPACVNPAHLELGTQRDNVRDMIDRGRGNWRAPKGEERHNAILSEHDVQYIRASTERGIDLAARFGVAPTTISAIRNGKRWKHIA